MCSIHENFKLLTFEFDEFESNTDENSSLLLSRLTRVLNSLLGIGRIVVVFFIVAVVAANLN